MSIPMQKPDPISPPRLDVKRSLLELAKILLALLAFTAVLFAGSLWTTSPELPWWRAGLPYAVAFISILFAHAGGHWLASSRSNVRYRFPWLIPSIGTGVGGYVDALPGTVSSAKSRVLIALTGPILGALVSTFWLFVGLGTSSVVQVSDSADTMLIGEPLLFKWASHVVFGTIPPGSDLYINSVVLAGWLGLVITACHLLPIEPFDGAFLLRALFPAQAGHLRFFALVALFGTGVFVGGPWAILSVVLGLGLLMERYLPTLYAILFWRNPSPDELPIESDLERKDIILAAALAVGLFAVCFTPVLIQLR